MTLPLAEVPVAKMMFLNQIAVFLGCGPNTMLTCLKAADAPAYRS
jgi:hypothetical protein